MQHSLSQPLEVEHGSTGGSGQSDLWPLTHLPAPLTRVARRCSHRLTAPGMLGHSDYCIHMSALRNHSVPLDLGETGGGWEDLRIYFNMCIYKYLLVISLYVCIYVYILHIYHVFICVYIFYVCIYIHAYELCTSMCILILN